MVVFSKRLYGKNSTFSTLKANVSLLVPRVSDGGLVSDVDQMGEVGGNGAEVGTTSGSVQWSQNLS